MESAELFKQASELFKSGEYSQALTLLEELDRSYPNQKRVLYPMARCLKELGRVAEALELCDRLIGELQYEKAGKLKAELLSAPPEEADLGKDAASLDNLLGDEQALFSHAKPLSVTPSRSRAWYGLAGALGVLVVIGLGAVVASKAEGTKASVETPKEALQLFVTAMDKGDVRGMMAVTHYEDEEVMGVVLKLMGKMRQLDNELDEFYGKPDNGWKATGIGGLTVEDIESDDFRVRIDEDTAEAEIWGDMSSDEIPLIKVEGAWYIDMVKNAPSGRELEQSLEMVKMLDEAWKEATNKIGKDGYTRDKILNEFMGAMMDSAMKQMKANAEAPVPPETEEAIRDAVDRFDEALADLSIAAFESVVYRDSFVHGSKRFFDFVTPDYLDYLADEGIETIVEDIKRIACPVPGQASVEVHIVFESPEGTREQDMWLMFTDEEDGEWKYSMSTNDDLLFPKPASSQIQQEKISMYVPLYPGVQFEPIEDMFGYTLGGPLREVDFDDRTGVEGTTPDDPRTVWKYYKEEMEGEWEDFVSSSGGGIPEVSGWKTFSDGRDIGTFVSMRPRNGRTQVVIIVGVLP